jgi:DnaK suppressor protein
MHNSRPSSCAQPRGGKPHQAEAVDAIDPKWRWHHRALLRLRAQLAGECAELQRETTAPAEQGGMDAADRAGERNEREAAGAELDAEADLLGEVDAALQRLRDGTYGLCEETGEPIPVARLNTLPWTRYCRAAAERRERLRQNRVGKIP